MGKLVAVAGVTGIFLVGREVLKNLEEGDTSEFREDQEVKEVAFELNDRLTIIQNEEFFNTIKFGFGDIRTAAVLGNLNKIAVNRDFWNSLEDNEKRLLVIHELCHLQRKEQSDRSGNMRSIMVSEKSESEEEEDTKRYEREYASKLFKSMDGYKFNSMYYSFETKIAQAQNGYVAPKSR